MALRGLLLLAGLLAATARAAAPAPFDLAGPTLEARITRGEQTLPAGQVPNLAAGDRIWIKADLPATQSAHYLMVLGFLSGSTNPPPEEWFFKCKTWKGDCASKGLSVTVPDGAQQVLLFLAPSASGDFSTLVDAVRGRPGAFVRASQDLNQAALDRSRLDQYLAAIREMNGADPARLREVAPLLARSLAIKIDDKCLERMPDLQAPCLMEGQEALILNDGHSTSIVEALTSGVDADLLLAASSTPQLGYGYYSPYIASVLDIARIMDSFRSAQYQYIPALASQRGDKLALTLNTAPSFHSPKSVLVVALPAVEGPQLPPLHAVDPKEIYCASRTALVLPVEGAPLVFSTGYAHDVTLGLSVGDGKTVELPARPDAAQGGYVIDTAGLAGGAYAQTLQATLHGYWGFSPYQGPSFRLRNAQPAPPALAEGGADGVIVGRQDTVHLQADSVSCIDSIMLKDPAGKELKADWKAVSANEVEVGLPLQDAQPGGISLLVRQYGQSEPQAVPLQAFAAPGRFDSFTLHAGDTQGVLKGSGLDEVVKLSAGKLTFVPQAAAPRAGDELPLAAQDGAAAAALQAGAALTAKVTLRDGRVFPLALTVAPARPRVLLIDKSVQWSRSSGDSNIQLANQDELPQDATLTFSLRAQTPAAFAHDEAIEVATADESFSATLSLANGGIMLQDAKVAVATLDPAKAFGASAFGPLQFRVLANGATGDWQPLATLVRLPALKDLKCPGAAELDCRLSGSKLFLVDSLSSDPQFAHPVAVPDGFPGYTLPVPHPADGRLYVKLRDNPAVINPVALEVQPLSPAASEFVRPVTVQDPAHPEQPSVVKPGEAPPAPDNAKPAAAAPAAASPAPAATTPAAQTGAPGDAAAPASRPSS